MNRSDQGSNRPTAEAVTAAVVLVAGLLYAYRALQEGIGTVAETGSGFFPLLVATVLVISSALVLIDECRTTSASTPADGTADGEASLEQLPGDDEGGPVEDLVSWPRIAGVLLASLAVPLLADTIGFVVTLSAAVVVIAKIMDMPGWLKPLLLGVIFGATSWLVFVYWLFVPLPAGSLGLA